jgi:hypothetical protein
MATKQIFAKFKVHATNEASAQVTIKVNGQEKFSGALEHNFDVFDPALVQLDDAVAVASFDLEVPNFESTAIIKPQIQFQSGVVYDLYNIEISVSGGSVVLHGLLSNFNPSPSGVTTTPTWRSTGAEELFTCDIASQPQRNGSPALDKFNAADYLGANVETKEDGLVIYNDIVPPLLTILDNETISADFRISKYK